MRETIISLVVAVATFVPVAAGADGMPPEASAAARSGTDSAPGKVTQADLQPDAPDSYTVVKGDTLWGISGRFLKDPWKWPQIWNLNRDQIKDPHWIYPGDVIKLDRSGANPSLSLESGGAGGSTEGASGGTAEQAASNVVKLDPRIRVEPLRTAIPTIPPSVIGPFLTQPLVVEAGVMDSAPSIVATEESRVVVGAGDVAYADRIGTGDSVNWQVFRPGPALKDPLSGEVLGYEARDVGDVRVRRFGDAATATTLDVVKSEQEINRGDRLAPAREGAFPSFIPHAPDRAIRGVIMTVDGGVYEAGQFQIVTLNRGARDGIEVGHVLAIVRRGEDVGAAERRADFFESGGWRGFGSFRGMDMQPNPVVPPVVSTSSTRAEVPDASRTRLRLPDERTGLLLVFRVFDKMSYGIVMRTTRPIYIGDGVQTP
jgi:LysM repeat protein